MATNYYLIVDLRHRAAKCAGTFTATQLTLAADLIEAHVDTGLELESWPVAVAFAERMAGHPIDLGDRWPTSKSWDKLHPEQVSSDV
jgi:hypothetical protein